MKLKHFRALFSGILLLFTLFPRGYGQVSFGGTPESFKLGIKSSPPETNLPAFSVDSMLRLDSLESAHGRKTYRFAKTFDVNFNPSNSGEWVSIPKQARIWRISFSSKGAFSIGILFRNFKPVPGARIYIYNPDHTEILGAFTSENIVPGGYLTVYPLPSENAIVEYDLPWDSDSSGTFTIAMLAHDYRNAFGKNAYADKSSDLSGSCNVDVNCSAGNAWQNEKRAVCKLLINQSVLCSAVLVNNVRQDGKAYLLTANHCVPTTNAAFNSLAIFNYEKEVCGTSTISANQSISGMWLRATTSNIDFSLLELGERPPASYNTYYAGWNIDTVSILSETAIHHPGGDVKKISFCSNPVVTANFGNGYENKSHWLINLWTFGDTEGGSSGCPLFDQNHYIIGTLTGGLSNCSLPDSDYFQKISRAWADLSAPSQQLKYWLDPDNTNTRKLSGLNPYTYNQTNCALHTNVLAGETNINPSIPGVSGYYAGHNGLVITQYADRFYSSDSIHLTAITMNVAMLSTPSLGTYLQMELWNGGAFPDSLIYSQYILYKTLVNNNNNVITLNFPITVIDTFYIGFKITYISGDAFALFITPSRSSNNANTAYALRSDSWISFPSIPEYTGLSTSLGIGYQSCDLSAGIQKLNMHKEDILVYPNPGRGVFNIAVPSGTSIESVSVYDLGGREIKHSILPVNESSFEIDIHSAAPGIYFLKLFSKQSNWMYKILKL